MIAAKPVVRCLLLVSAGLIAGCAAGLGIPWVPQGPGDTAETARARREAQARGEPAPVPVAQAPVAREERVAPRVLEVAPDLITQTAPPPRNAAAQAAAVAATPAYTQATRYGDLLFVSGQIALDSASQLRGTTIDEQTRQVMENVRAALESHRLTLANVVSVTVYLKDLNDFRGMNVAYESFFRTALPARSVVEVSRLPRGALVEIAVIAGR